MNSTRKNRKNHVKRALLVGGIVALLAAGTSHAAETTFSFGVSDQRQNVTFESETDFEVILGSTNQLQGRIVADLEAGTGSVDVEVPVESLRTGIDLRDKHLRSGKWLDAKKNPMISFKSTSARRVEGNRWEVSGTFTLHGVSREITVEADVRAIPEAIAKKGGMEKGDWLRVVVPFEVKLSDFGVKIPSKAAGRVNDTWKVRIQGFASTKG